ncbi:hypothetical protein [Streptomyces triticirhizae]|uniref:hypothetical protein n=1 Tax=Streptomyces triticirhizae TaxID=2483353 RepID=UPI0011C38E13|nr:hypothetical protein [Streptomyces triticirhizae]
MTADQQPNPSRPPGGEAPATPPPSSVPVGQPGTPLPGAVPPWQPPAYQQAPPPPGPHVPPPAAPPFPHQGPLAWPPAPPAKPRNATGVAALLLAVVAACFCWTYYLSPLALVLGAFAIGCGLIGSGRAKRGAATNRQVALGGMWIGAGAAVVAAVLTVVLIVEESRITTVETSAGSDYLAEPGDDVTYTDGLVVHASQVQAGDGLTAVITLTLTNETGGEISLADDAMRVFDEGRRLPPENVRRADGAPGEVADGASVDVSYVVVVDPGLGGLTIDYRPDDDHDWAYWWLSLPGQREFDREPSDGGEGNNDDGEPPGASLDV